jgi:hypothetical protein
MVDLLILPVEMMLFITWLHSLYLSKGREIVSVLVLIDQPNTVFVSEGWPSAKNFFNEMISFHGMSSLGYTGLGIM